MQCPTKHEEYRAFASQARGQAGLLSSGFQRQLLTCDDVADSVNRGAGESQPVAHAAVRIRELGEIRFRQENRLICEGNSTQSQPRARIDAESSKTQVMMFPKPAPNNSHSLNLAESQAAR